MLQFQSSAPSKRKIPQIKVFEAGLYLQCHGHPHLFNTCFTPCPGCSWYSFHLHKDALKENHFVPAWRTKQLISPSSYFWGDSLPQDACVSLGNTLWFFCKQWGITLPMTSRSRSSGTQRMEIVILVLPRPAWELVSIWSGVALPISQAPMVKGCVGAGKAISSPLP